MKHLKRFNESSDPNIGLIEDVFINLTDEFDNIGVSVKSYIPNGPAGRRLSNEWKESYYTIISFDVKSKRSILPKINSCYDIIESYGFEKMIIDSNVGTSISIFYISK